ncbi:MAG: hypothetical protein OEO77_05670 [Acidimicrobiia bacterium]|nr:hypothetical protein [Acidimicrobiia bacterium]
MERTKDPAKRALGIVLAVVAVAAVVGGVLASQRETTLLDPRTPAGVVQNYLTAVLDNDQQAALEWFTDELKASCESDYGFSSVDATRVVLDETTIDGESAVIVVTIQVSTDPFSEYSYQERIHLVAVADGWAIDRTPWPYFGCR